MTERLHIPYERSSDLSNAEHAPAVLFFKENRQYQMRYTRKAVESNAYREWVTQLTKKELEDFIVANQTKLNSALSHKVMGPKFPEKYFWRNALYELELLYREYGPDLPFEIYETWQEETLSDYKYWEGKFRIARSRWQQENGVQEEASASAVTPYY